MIIYAMIVRTKDGMALSATTDFNDEINKNIKDSKRYLKFIAKKTAQYPDRCSVKLQSYIVHFITSLGVSYLALCESSYPAVLAFSFLDELVKDFVTLYETRKVNEARRPYAFIEFDNFIHKTRQRYNKPQSLTTRVNLSELSLEIKLRPPHILTLSDIDPTLNGYAGGSYTQLSVGAPPRLEPISWLGIATMSVTVLLALINFYRGMSALSSSSIEEYDGPSPTHALLFLLECFLQCCQIVLLVTYTRYRKLESWMGLLFVCACNIYVWEIRDLWQVLLYIGVASTMHFCIVTRQFQTKLPNYDV